MHCPRCGAELKKDDRYCASCGATIAKEEKPPRSLRERVAELVGTTRRARIITAATVAAIAAAVAALIVIFVTEDPDEAEVPQDEYTFAADEVCVAAKEQVVAAFRASPAPGPLAQALVPVVAEWRSAFNELEVPEDRAELAAELDTALRQVETEAGAMAGAAREGDQEAVLARAAETDQATSRVEEAIDSLALERCGEQAFTLAPAPE